MPAATFGALLDRTFQIFKSAWKPLIVGILILGVPLGAGIAAMETSVGSIQMSMAQEMFGMSEAEFDDFQKRIERGDEEAFAELGAVIDERFNGDVGLMKAEMQGRQMEALWSFFTLGLPLFLVFSLLCLAFQPFVYLCASGERNAGVLFKRSFGLVLPFVGINFLRLFVSYMWIGFVIMLGGVLLAVQDPDLGGPVIGLGYLLFIVLAMVMMPRMLFAELIAVRERPGVLSSLRLSRERTQGYWGKIVGNLLLASLLMFAANFIVFIAAALLAVMGPFVGMAILVVWLLLLQTLMLIFIHELGITVMQNPRPVAAKAA